MTTKATDSSINDVSASNLFIRDSSEFSGILDLSPQTTPQITLDTGEFLSYNKSTNLFSGTGALVEAANLKTVTGTVSISTATAPTIGQVLTATSSTAATWQDSSSGNAFLDNVFEIQDNTDNTIVIDFDAAGTTGTTTTITSSQTTDRTLTLPNATDTIVARSTTETLTNKTMRGPNGSIGSPTYSFSGNTNTGFYLEGSDVSYSANGTESVGFSSSGVSVILNDGSFIANGYNFGAAAGGIGPASSALTYTVNGVRQNYSSTGLTVVDSTSAIPAGSILLAVSYDFDNAPAGPATFDLGTPADSTKWFTAASVGTGNTGRVGAAFEYFASATTVRVTFNITTTGTAIPGLRIVLFYISVSTP